MKSNYKQQGKTAAITAYITILGTIIAFFMNNDDKNSFASFHIRQALGIHILFYLTGAFVTIFYFWMIDAAFYLFVFVLWMYGLITAIQEEEKTIPVLGPYFQKWFSTIT